MRALLISIATVTLGCATLPVATERPAATDGEASEKASNQAAAQSQQAQSQQAAVQAATPIEANRRGALKAAICQAPRFRELLVRAYGARAGRSLFVKGDHTGPGAREAVVLLAEVSSHGLNAADYPTARLNALMEAISEAQRNYHARRVAAAAGLRTRARASAWLGARNRAQVALQEALARFDVSLAAALIQYFLDFRGLRKVHPFLAHTALEQRHPELLAGDLTDELGAFLARAAHGPAQAMVALWPKHPDYQRTREALKRYRKRVATSTRWAAERGLVAGRTGPAVSRLKARLAVEGYWQGPTDPHFGATLTAAVRRFQKHHGLVEDGKIGRRGETARALAVPLRDRVAQLELSLQRHREAQLATGALWIRVNVPRFRLELWQNKTRVLTRRVVVGRAGSTLDPSTKLPLGLNRTPLLASAVESVVLNPGWFVPPRIVQKELAPRAAKSADFYRSRGFRVRSIGGKGVRLWQAPGPRNALGRVKLRFPNSEAIFIHDTPAKGSFEAASRAKSHGCVRLSDPMTVARLLLEWDGMTPDGVERTLRAGRTFRRRLKHPVALSLVYNTVAFEPGDSEVYFLPDIYGYDAAAQTRQLPYSRRARYAARKRDEALQKRLAEPRETGCGKRTATWGGP